LSLQGLYGNNEADAAERLLARAIDQLIRDGSLKREEELQIFGMMVYLPVEPCFVGECRIAVPRLSQ
jgi:hypothetical protein